jgi:ankyrin repeat protein
MEKGKAMLRLPIFICLLLLNASLWATHLHKAVKEVNEVRIRSLVQMGADVNATDEQGRTPLHLAAKIGRYSIVKYLVEHGSDVHKKDDFHKTPLVYAIEKNRIKVIVYLSKVVNKTQRKEEEDALFLSVKENDLDRLSYNLTRRDINSVDRDGKTVLHIASEAGNLEIVKFLLGMGADRTILDYDGRNALSYAKLTGNKELIKVLSQD